MFQVGDRLVHPGAGACEVREVSKKEMYELPARMYYTLWPMQGKGTTWMIPVDSAEKIGLRRIMSCEDADALLDSFHSLGASWISDRTARARHYSEIFKDTSIHGMRNMLQALKMLMAREPLGKLPLDDKEMLRKLETKVVSELAVAKEMEYHRVTEYMSNCMEQSTPA